MRRYLVDSLNEQLSILDELEEKRKKYSIGSDEWKNLTGSIFHHEGRVKQIRRTLQYMDYGR